ncbi:hypothetical protein HY448_01030 [Candidatus Pacearchaeota archaeon]|nr:hypothetical protein [Candidatus Pacearchaeota archaeon]
MRFKPIIVLLYLLFGLYLINQSFGFFKTPDFFEDFDFWIIAVSGFMLLIAAVIALMSKKPVPK